MDNILCRAFGHKPNWEAHIERDEENRQWLPIYLLKCKRCGCRGGTVRDNDRNFTMAHYEIARRFGVRLPT